MTDYRTRIEEEAVRRAYQGHGEKVHLSAAGIGEAAGEPDYSGKRSNLLSMEKRAAVNRALKELESSGLLKLKRIKDPHAVVYRADISREQAGQLYGRYGYTDREESEILLQSEIRKFMESCRLMPQTAAYLSHVLLCPFGRDSVWMKTKNFGLSDIEEGLDVIRGADAVIRSGEEGKNILVRNLSSSVYGSSKTFERYETRICTSVRRILLCDAAEDWELLFDEAQRAGKKEYELFGVSKNPFSEIIRGNAEIQTPNGTVHTCGCSYAFFSDEEASYLHIRIRDSRLITIENLTTYHDFTEPSVLKVYTGGMPSPFLQRLLRRIAEDNPGLMFYHWSDIDVGGFRIFRLISQSTEGRVIPYHMDIETIQKAAARVPLSDWDREQLQNFRQIDCFSETAAYMLKENVKVEQESERI